MKKNNYITAILLFFALAATSQTKQMKYWSIAPKQIEMIVNPNPVAIQTTTYLQAPATATQVGNGMYDQGGNLLFYVANEKVYDYNNSQIGTIHTGGAEIIIVPFGNNNGQCQRKFNIFSTAGGFATMTGLYQAVVDMNSFSVSASNTPIDNISLNGQPSTEFGALAVSNLNPNGDRYLYFMAGSGTVTSYPTDAGQIHKMNIAQDGTINTIKKLFPPAPFVNDGAEVFSKELDLSPDGKWLAWASFAPVNIANHPPQRRYHFLNLDSNGDYINISYQKFNITAATGNDNSSGFRGVEFYQNATHTINKLYVGAGSSGIYVTDIPIISNPPLATQVLSSQGTIGYGNSQIELANNGFMYASSGKSTDNIGAFNPSIAFPAILTPPKTFNLTKPITAE